MPHVFTAAANSMAIAEREHGSAATIKFTGFSSCFGVVVLHNGQLTAVHLAMRGTDNSLFDIAAADAVIALLPAGYTSSATIGSLSMWALASNNVSAGYLSLIGRLTNLTPYQFGDGTYGAEIDAGAISPTY